jgi:hypothetical protein
MHHDNRTIIPALVLLLIPVGCLPPPPPDGIRVECDGSAVGFLWYERPIICAADDADCYIERHKFRLCIDPNAQVAETGFDEENWFNDTASVDYIRARCSEECIDANSPYAEPYAGLFAICSDPNLMDDEHPAWTIRNEDGYATPDPSHIIEDPGHLSCLITENSNLRPKPAPVDLTVIAPGTTPRWPSTSEYIELICDNFQDCSAEFLAPILGYLLYEDVNGDWGDNMGRADYVAMTSVDTATSVTLSIDNPNSGTSSETNQVEGRIEYSAPDCGETECPFYVANMTLANPVDAWDLWSEFQAEPIHVTDIRARLRRPVLGIWNTETNEVYIGEGMIEAHVEATVAVGDGELETIAYFAMNDADLFGELRGGGGVSFSSLTGSEGNMLALQATLDYDVLGESPPIASIGLPNTVAAPTESGLPISSIMDGSSDPDGDIAAKFWVVDGQLHADDYVIPIGSHTLVLEVHDERGVYDIDQQAVTISYP